MNHHEFMEFGNVYTNKYRITSFLLVCSFDEFDLNNLKLINEQNLESCKFFNMIAKMRFPSERFEKQVIVKLYRKCCQIIGTDQEDCLNVFYYLAKILNIDIDKTKYECKQIVANVELSHDKSFSELNNILSEYKISGNKVMSMIKLNEIPIIISNKIIVCGKSYFEIENNTRHLCELIGNCELVDSLGPKFANKK
jgi:hypothetical protein